MATRQNRVRASALPEPATNVVRLPTAPRRQVQQNYNRAKFAARKLLPQFTGEHICPGRRRALKDAAIIQDVGPSAALSLALGLFFALDTEGQQRAREALVKAGDPRYFPAFAILLHRHTIGEQLDLQWALDRLAGRA